MSKICIINSCRDCPYKYHSYEEGWMCSKTKRKNNSLCWDLFDTENRYSDTIKTFPEWCPLEEKK